MPRVDAAEGRSLGLPSMDHLRAGVPEEPPVRVRLGLHCRSGRLPSFCLGWACWLTLVPLNVARLRGHLRKEQAGVVSLGLRMFPVQYCIRPHTYELR